MIKSSLSTLNGQKVELNIPENASEIPLKRFIPAKYEWQKIDALFSNRQPWTEWQYLKRVIEFISFILDVDNNALIGFKAGNFVENVESLAYVLTKSGKWSQIDITIYRLYSHLSRVLRDAKVGHKEGNLCFNYKNEDWFVPEFLGKVDIFNGILPIDLKAWQGVELGEVMRIAGKYLDGTAMKDEYGNPLSILEINDNEIQVFADKEYNALLKVIAVLVRKKDMEIADMNSQEHIDQLIEKRAEYFIDIDTQTALNVFFFGLNIGAWSQHMTAINIFSLRQALADQ